MTSEQLELASLRRELAWLMQSEAVKSMSQKDENGKHKYNIKGLDDCIQTLHKRALSAESKLSAANTELIALRSENMRLRRQIEAIADPPAKTSPVQGEVSAAVSRKADDGRVADQSGAAEEKQFPLFSGKKGGLFIAGADMNHTGSGGGGKT